jgi:hypothetical protein
LKCRDKDWIGGPCSTTDDEYITALTAERDAAIREREELQDKLNHCPECNGEGHHDSGCMDASGEWINLPCEGCGSTGTMDGYIEATDKLQARVAELEAARITQSLTADRFASAVAEADSLRARVAELEAKLAPRANDDGVSNHAAQAASGGGEQEPVAWGVVQSGSVVTARLNEREAKKASEVWLSSTVVPLYRQPPQLCGWLTDEELEAVNAARDYFDDDDHGDSECVFIARVLKQLLARSLPPGPEGE